MDALAHEYPSLSSYAYVGNNPVNAIDPDGRKIVIVSNKYSANMPNQSMKKMMEKAFRGQVNITFENGGIDYGSNFVMNINLKEGAELSKSEMAIYNSIKKYADNGDRLEVSVGDGSQDGEVDSWLFSMINPDNVDNLPEGTEGFTQLTSIDHFFDEQYAKQFINKGKGNYDGDHTYALSQGKDKFGFKWGKDYAPKDAGYQQVDVFDAKGIYHHTVKATQTENGPAFETFIK